MNLQYYRLRAAKREDYLCFCVAEWHKIHLSGLAHRFCIYTN